MHSSNDNMGDGLALKITQIKQYFKMYFTHGVEHILTVYLGLKIQNCNHE